MDETRFRALVAELDGGVPRVDDAVRMVQVEDGVRVIATRQGALRLGIAILREALGMEDDGPDELSTLVDVHGDTSIERVRVVTALPDPDDRSHEAPRERRMNFGCGVMAIVLFFLAFCGVIYLGEMIVSWFRPG